MHSTATRLPLGAMPGSGMIAKAWPHSVAVRPESKTTTHTLPSAGNSTRCKIGFGWHGFRRCGMGHGGELFPIDPEWAHLTTDELTKCRGHLKQQLRFINESLGVAKPRLNESERSVAPA